MSPFMYCKLKICNKNFERRCEDGGWSGSFSQQRTVGKAEPKLYEVLYEVRKREICERNKVRMNIRIGNEMDKQYILSIRPHAAGLFSEKGYFVVAEEDAVLGCTTVISRDIEAPILVSEAFVNLIEVFDESDFRKGIASRMVNYVIQIEKAKGTYQVRAYCDIHNIASHKLWLKCGFGISPVKMMDGKICGSYVTYTL